MTIKQDGESSASYMKIEIGTTEVLHKNHTQAMNSLLERLSQCLANESTTYFDFQPL